ncbi:hypothetical protein [Kibdelosporangium aridum]|uniref:Uncharacterized protein n=1 Tax=Kibdelosporangium aridum TaxID=2030 RepID=A0A1Y5XX84_KIBAR|nr:hypothetical protein [Kibdelosporangium aridum]SMD20980.1 hypothetical protein SAMN05661093_06660 [Kibdelosporangium aridum]
MAEEVLQGLADRARETAPRTFCVYGVRHDRMGDESDTFMAWGLEFSNPPRAVLLHRDGTVWMSDSATRALNSHQIGAEARLLWLD